MLCLEDSKNLEALRFPKANYKSNFKDSQRLAAVTQYVTIANFELRS